MSVLCTSTRRLARALAICSAASVFGAVAAAAPAGPIVHTGRGCYLVGQRVTVSGAGFAPSRMFDVTIDGVDFGQSATDSVGAFSSALIPGGLGAGQAQHVEHLDATDGTKSADTTFTVTRKPGGRLLATTGNPHSLRAPFEVWGFGLDGAHVAVYLHYVSPTGHQRTTVGFGQTGGQCGYLLTRTRRVFPFSPSLGTWTLQLDTSRIYSRVPTGPVVKIRVQILKG